MLGFFPKVSSRAWPRRPGRDLRAMIPPLPSRQIGDAPFASFFERQRQREARARIRRRVLLISIAFHVVVLGATVLLSIWHSEDLYAENVAVRMSIENAGRTNAARATGLRLRVASSGVLLESVAAASEGVSDSARDYLVGLQAAALLPALRYPDAARARGLRAEVTLRLAIASDGRLDSVEVKAPCPHSVLCEAAIEAARGAAPFAAHDGSAGDPWPISVPIVFAP